MRLVCYCSSPTHAWAVRCNGKKVQIPLSRPLTCKHPADVRACAVDQNLTQLRRERETDGSGCGRVAWQLVLLSGWMHDGCQTMEQGKWGCREIQVRGWSYLDLLGTMDTTECRGICCDVCKTAAPSAVILKAACWQRAEVP